MKHLIIIHLGLVASVFGNGGGYFRGGVEQVGDVAGFEPENTDHVRIMDERLEVKLGPKSAEVSVRYVMKNEGDQAAKVRFGFPVEESKDRDDYGYGGEKPEPTKGLKYCQNYRVEVGGKALKAKWEEEKKPASDEAGKEQKIQDHRFEGIQGWLVSTATFPPHQETEVKISFESGYSEENWFVSDDSHLGEGIFRYRLSTGAAWAGSIAQGRIELIPDGIDPAELRVIKPVNRFKREGDRWVWQFDDLEPTLADDLEIEARPEERGFHRPYDAKSEDDRVDFIDRGGKWSMSHKNYEVHASSTLPADGSNHYDAENVKSWTTAWSEGAEGPGIGEWIEMKPEVPKPLKAIRIRAGYDGDDPSLFTKNARPKRVEVVLNGEHRFEAELEDTREEQRIAVAGYDRPVKSARLVFKEVYPGSEYEDLCVSGLQLEVALDEKPEIQPAR
ncbi:NADase-type glycan-binding domain-containing protein [Haloferula sargassicola]|uniref:NAD glycohydrolase translocation F5/8 type C domain-containing protein n=1 Tax=Haloferula sargassicola TaxID=490096 RepID=A0ABP9URE4_9BACT